MFYRLINKFKLFRLGDEISSYRKPKPDELVKAVFNLVEKREFKKFKEVEKVLKKGISDLSPLVQSRYSMKKSLKIAEEVISKIGCDSTKFWISNSIFKLFVLKLFDVKKRSFR